MKATLLYTLARIGVFAVVFAVLRFTPLNVYLAVIFAAIIALIISYLCFGKLRQGVAESIVRRRAAPERDEDAELEDAVLDGAPYDASTATVRPATARPASARRPAPPAEDD